MPRWAERRVVLKSGNRMNATVSASTVSDNTASTSTGWEIGSFSFALANTSPSDPTPTIWKKNGRSSVGGETSALTSSIPLPGPWGPVRSANTLSTAYVGVSTGVYFSLPATSRSVVRLDSGNGCGLTNNVATLAE